MSAYLLLHGGGGQRTVAGFAALLASRTGAQVLAPTHPGFGGTAGLGTIADLARFYVDGLETDDVTVVGNSFGGWVAAEIGLLGSPRIREVVLVDAVGIEVPGHPVANVGAMTPAELAAHAWHDPSKAPAPGGPSPDIQALIAYTGPAMADPTLLDRLRGLDVPAHVIWGASDRVVDVAHAEAFAAAIPKSRLTVLPASGHLPQLETPEALLAALLA